MQKQGKTYIFENPPVIIGAAGVAGKKEGEGPLRDDFDAIFEDTTMGQNSFELAESAMLHDAVIRAMSNAGVSPSDVNFIMTGDLLNQCTGSCFALKDLQIPFIGMYGACSTMALTLANASMLASAGADICVCGASSHFASSERQFRYPLEYGGQRPPTAQWTVTGAGSMVVANSSATNQTSPYIKAIHIGTITDLGIKDANNMGAAMAPSVCIIRPCPEKPSIYAGFGILVVREFLQNILRKLVMLYKKLKPPVENNRKTEVKMIVKNNINFVDFEIINQRQRKAKNIRYNSLNIWSFACIKSLKSNNRKLYDDLICSGRLGNYIELAGKKYKEEFEVQLYVLQNGNDRLDAKEADKLAYGEIMKKILSTKTLLSKDEFDLDKKEEENDS